MLDQLRLNSGRREERFPCDNATPGKLLGRCSPIDAPERAIQLIALQRPSTHEQAEQTRLSVGTRSVLHIHWTLQGNAEI